MIQEAMRIDETNFLTVFSVAASLELCTSIIIVVCGTFREPLSFLAGELAGI